MPCLASLQQNLSAWNATGSGHGMNPMLLAQDFCVWWTPTKPAGLTMAVGSLAGGGAGTRSHNPQAPEVPAQCGGAGPGRSRTASSTH